MKLFKASRGLPFVLILAILFASCGRHYSNDIGDRMTAQQCKSMPVNDSVAELYTAGYVSITYNQDAPNSNPQICDSIYVVSKTWWQAWQDGKKDGSVLIFWIALILTIVFIAVFIWSLENQRQSDGKAPLGWLFPMFACFIVCAFALNWDKWNTDREIRKQDYVQEVQAFGCLKYFWETPAKHY